MSDAHWVSTFEDDPPKPTRCISGKEHGEFVASDDDHFDPRLIRNYADVVLEDERSRIGHCLDCGTAMRYDHELQRIVDWPDANVVPHCDQCRQAIRGHYLERIVVRTQSYMGPGWNPARPDIQWPPAIDEAVACGPLCLMYMLLDSSILQDVFGR